MLIRFKVANFLSFKEETEFSMVAGKERIHPHHVVKGEKNQPNLLRTALLYGANAAGKSNFVKAILFAKSVVLLGVETAESLAKGEFRLDENCLGKPSKFIFEIKTAGKVYEYGFEVGHGKVYKEWLIELIGKAERLLFKRKTNEKGESSFEEIDFLESKEDKLFLKFVQKSTRKNECFLSHAVDNNVDWLYQPALWFGSLQVVLPDISSSILTTKFVDTKEFVNFSQNLLSMAGTGIRSISLEQLPSQNITESAFKGLSTHKSFTGIGNFKNGFVVAEFKDSLLNVNKLITFHEKEIDQGLHKFELGEESDGTRRLIELSPAFFGLIYGTVGTIYIIDELERSLHPNLSYMLLKSYLEQGNNPTAQLIATTHQTHLLDLDLLRRDEIWFAEKDEHGATQLYSLYEFNPRYDKKIEKEYLTGRFGAIPFLGNLEFKKQLAKNSRSKK